MHYRGKKTLLFIEPSLSSLLLLNKAKEKRYTTLVISSNSTQQTLLEGALTASSSFFQINTNNHMAVLDLVDKIAQKFYIDGVIPGAANSILLTSKVATYLNKPGLTPASALRLLEKDLLWDTLKAHSIPTPHQQGALVDEDIQGKEYSIEGFLRNNDAHIVSIIEKLFLAESNGTDKGCIVCSEIEPDLSEMIGSYVKKVISALQLDYGPFQAEIKLTEKGPILIEIAMHTARGHLPKLIKYATGIDYYDNILNLFSAQPLFLHKTLNANAGILYFYNPPYTETSLKKYFESLLDNPYVKEVKVYDDDEETLDPSPKKLKAGHAILLHKHYVNLKQLMEEVEINAPFS